MMIEEREGVKCGSIHMGPSPNATYPPLRLRCAVGGGAVVQQQVHTAAHGACKGLDAWSSSAHPGQQRGKYEV
jgi:hypothetical protein